MKKSIVLLTAFLIVLLTGCATNFPNPIRVSHTKDPTIIIVQQGSIPAANIYRENFIIVDSNNNARAFFTPEIVAQMVAGGLTAISDITDKTTLKYYDTLKNNYRWRTDIFISGVTNLTEEKIIEILKAGIQPKFDAQRSPIIQK
jgi:hypothetical protein